jgi:hypothetical protein
VNEAAADRDRIQGMRRACLGDFRDRCAMRGARHKRGHDEEFTT